MLTPSLDYTTKINLLEDQTSNLTTTPIDLGRVIKDHSVQLKIASASSLTLIVVVEWSIDGINWNELFVFQTGVTAEDGVFAKAREGVSAKFIRATVTFAAGTGNVNLKYLGV